MAVEMVAVATETYSAERRPGVENPGLADPAIRAPKATIGTTR